MTRYAHSTVDNPVQVVHAAFRAHSGTLSRAELIEHCVSKGVNRNTASTQYDFCKRYPSLIKQGKK